MHKRIELRFLKVWYILELSKCKELFFHPPGDCETEASSTTAAIAASIAHNNTSLTLPSSQSPHLSNPRGQSTSELLSVQALSHLTMILYDVWSPYQDSAAGHSKVQYSSYSHPYSLWLLSCGPLGTSIHMSSTLPTHLCHDRIRIPLQCWCGCSA